MSGRTRHDANYMVAALAGDDPVCARCADFNVPGATFCASCGAPLTERVAYLNRTARLLRDETGRWFRTPPPARRAA